MIPEVYIVLDNVKYAQNIGPIFRLADAFNVKKMFFCKDNQEKLNSCQLQILNKASRGLINHVEWEFTSSCVDVLTELKEKGVNLYCIETGDDSKFLKDVNFRYPMALVFGSENFGVSPEVMDISDEKIRIPMLGIGKSLNVSNCISIALYEAVRNYI